MIGFKESRGGFYDNPNFDKSPNEIGMIYLKCGAFAGIDTVSDMDFNMIYLCTCSEQDIREWTCIISELSLFFMIICRHNVIIIMPALQKEREKDDVLMVAFS